MKSPINRRNFIRDTSVTATGLFFVSSLGTNHKALKELAVGCAPPKPTQLFGSVGSVKSGNWSDPATWGGRVPAATDTPLIASGHVVKFDVADATVAGINVNNGGTLEFDSLKTVTLQSNKNIVIEGTLKMRPSSFSQVHTLRFIGINEKNFVGGGMDPVASDIGLWVMANGRLDIVGSEVTPWTRVTDTVAAGSSSFSLVTSPKGWSAGDDVVLVPTATPEEESLGYDTVRMQVKDKFRHNFEKRTIGSVSGSSVKVTSPFSYNTHQKVVMPEGPTWTAEILNLKRNVRIEGTATGRSHIMIRSTVAQTVQNAALRYLGPRKPQTSSRGDMIAGRYALHFHHCRYGSNGSQVTGNVAYECGNHVYVPHVSHGINMSNNVVYDCIEVGFWWDEGADHMTHFITWNNNLMALNYYIPGTSDQTGTKTSTTSGGMLFGMGDNNVANGNVAVYCGLGYVRSKGAFSWEADNIGVWEFENNLAHSNHCAVRVWQNTTHNHTVFGLQCYNNLMHLFHGAYSNSYTYRDSVFYDGEILIKASSGNTNGVRLENCKFIQRNNRPHAVVVSRGAVPTAEMQENLFFNCVFKGYTAAAVLNEAGGAVISGELRNERKGVALVNCDFGGGKPWAFTYTGSNTEHVTNPTGWFRIQPRSGQPQHIVKGSTSSPIIKNIAPFAPSFIGAGKGLKGEYFNDATFGKKVFERIDSTIMFKQWYKSKDFYKLPLGVHHLITGSAHSTRWTGKIQAQYTEPYQIGFSGSGGYRIWISGKLVLDSPKDKFDDRDLLFSTPVPMVAGQSYDIKVEYFSTGGYSTAYIYWKCPSMEQAVLVPQSQLFTGAVSTTPTPVETTNQGPTANAGADLTISLPTTSVTLNGAGSSDPDGSIASYKWTVVSGPNVPTIANATAVSTAVNSLVAGTYIFRLEVKDSKGVMATDDVTVTVNAAGNQGPTANAGADITITLPVNSTTLNGAASKDPDGTIAFYKWTKVSGPGQFIMGNASAATTSLSNLVAGVYVFSLEVKDSKGATATDTVTVTVNENIADSTAPEQIKITVGPNPTTTEFKVQVTTVLDGWMIVKFYNNLNHKMAEYKYVRSGFTVNIGKDWRPGTYYIVVERGPVRARTSMVKLPS
jgi:hypothetical protein